MIDTELTVLLPDLKEVENLFNRSDLNIKHLFKRREGKVVNTIVVNGKAYAYGNLLSDELSPVEEKRLVKRYAKLSLYKALSSYLNANMPWGALTGIRPTKLAYKQIEETGEFYDFFTETMKVSVEKTKLTQSVINSQKGIYEKNDDNTDFFVFIPFCPSKCKYCSFISSDLKFAGKFLDDYVDALVYEIKYSKQFVKKLRSIYIGGGTPVCLTNDKLEKVLCAIDEINNGVEYTVEAGRPDAITKENLKILKQHGVTRICVNPQTFSDKTLKLLGRNHTANDILEKYMLVANDFSVNMDLIAGLPEEDLQDFKNSLQKTIELSPDNITVHTLCAKRGSSLSSCEVRAFENETEKMIEFAHAELSQVGYSPYYLYRQKNMAGNLENTGYTKPNKACLYNIDVMEEISQNVACGSNAVSKRVFNKEERVERFATPKDIKTYLEKIETIKQKKEAFFSNIIN